MVSNQVNQIIKKKFFKKIRIYTINTSEGEWQLQLFLEDKVDSIKIIESLNTYTSSNLKGRLHSTTTPIEILDSGSDSITMPVIHK